MRFQISKHHLLSRQENKTIVSGTCNKPSSVDLNQNNTIEKVWIKISTQNLNIQKMKVGWRGTNNNNFYKIDDMSF